MRPILSSPLAHFCRCEYELAVVVRVTRSSWTTSKRCFKLLNEIRRIYVNLGCPPIPGVCSFARPSWMPQEARGAARRFHVDSLDLLEMA